MEICLIINTVIGSLVVLIFCYSYYFEKDAKENRVLIEDLQKKIAINDEGLQDLTAVVNKELEK